MRDMSRIAILAAAAVAMAGCTNLDGSANNTATGGLIGAGAGAVIGRAIDGGGRPGRWSAARSAAWPAPRSARRSTGSSGSSRPGCRAAARRSSNTGNQLVVTLPESITFDSDSAVVHPDYVDEIAFVARSLREHPELDGPGDRAYRQHRRRPPTTRRSASSAPPSVAAILTQNGVASGRVQTAGVGYAQPVASNDTPGGRAQNRRVQIIITPTTSA